jgi:N-acetylglucosaminyldiphosphoundecaprenol N-acetyl-beta-D-mannosaminyltransferase
VKGLKVVGVESPPFRPLTPKEEQTLLAKLKRLKVDLLWVGLGAPKQEKWMARMKGKINCTMLGVGAAFDYYAGTLPEAPRWMQSVALEWLYRLFHEPGRLWKRYFLTNSLFILLAPLEFLRLWPGRTKPS